MTLEKPSETTLKQNLALFEYYPVQLMLQALHNL